ncbi:hypothetical protein CG419_02690 [Latilactobacillus curvatus]|uniref:Uncharacterized protein n=1 Tax=Latilactobacillus curvatus TaxID=28038 RepID=A0AAC9UN20_LATCU|nr:hypothetical protein [Latilactobacillus curvatus]ASN59592.1 hypothetical protein CG419_02690 [Latilactobacillus curvatus]
MKLFKNVSYTILSNFLNILASTLIVLIIPKFIGVHSYGMWQVFIFYANYIGILHFGWADGLFLRRGGQHTINIDIGSLKAETILYIAFNSILGLIFIITGFLNISDYAFIIIALGVGIIVVNIRTWITMILQSTGNFKGYAINLSVQSLVYLVLILIILLLRITDYRVMISAFIVSQLTTSISGIIQLRRQFGSFKVQSNFKSAISELKLNIDSGFKLMVANFTAMLIVGIIRFGIQQQWTVSTFGKVSLVLSIANLITVFINAISLVLFPTLRRTKQVAQEVYLGIRDLLMPLLYGIMIIYFPIVIIIPLWLPEYSDALRYTSILMPMMVYQGKFEILSNTFMKNFRMESKLMMINIATLIISAALTGLTVYLLHNLTLAIFSIALVLGIRSIISEIILSKVIKVSYIKELLFENIGILGFMALTWYCSVSISFIVYFGLLLMYLILKLSSMKRGFIVLKELSKY